MRLAASHSTVMDTEDTKMGETIVNGEAGSSAVPGPEADKPGDRMFTLKKWNAVAMWSWDVECDTCAICRVQVMDACLRCQSETKGRVHLIII